MNKKRAFIFLCLFMVFISTISFACAVEDGGSSAVSTPVENTPGVQASNSQNNVLTSPSESFTQLNNLIQSTPVNGSIKLSNNYTYTSGDSSNGISIDKNITIDGDGYTIDGANSASIFHITNKANVILKNIVFANALGTNGSAISLTSSENVQIINCRFINNSASNGGAIYVAAADPSVITSSSSIVGSTFIDNRALYGGAIYVIGTLTSISSSTFKYNNASEDGGSMYFNVGAHINNCLFQHGLAGHDGGAIYLDSIVRDASLINPSLLSKLGVFNSTIEFCSAGNDGGAGYINSSSSAVINVTFTSNTAGNDGGACYVDGDHANLIDSTFMNNTASNYGGAIMWRGVKGTINGISAINNTATSKGGSIYVEGDDTNILNSHFSFTKALLGAGIFISGDRGVVDNSKFTNVNATGPYGGGYGGSGGGVYIEGSDARVSNSDFKSATTMNYGGGISVWGSNANLTGNTFDKCSAEAWHGGAIYANGINTIISKSNFTQNRVNISRSHGAAIEVQGDATKILDCNFAQCIAYDGGIIYVDGENVVIDGCNLTNSTATHYGGAIYVKGQSVKITNSRMMYNNASEFGGAIFVEGSNANIDGDEFTYCHAEREGGAIFVKGQFATITNSRMMYNNANNNNDSGFGGAIYVDGSYAHIIGDEFMYCSAAFYGGAIYISGWEAIISKSNFTKNNAPSWGGSIAIAGYYTKILESNFDYSYARDGGVIYVFGDETLINGSNFTHSSAQEYAGVIYIAGNQVTISNSFMKYNNATWEGGAVFVQGNNAKIINSTFERCSSVNTNGGAIYVNGTNATIEKSNFIMNSANGTNARGGSIEIQGNNTKISDSIFTNCSAYYGAVIYLNGTNTIIDGSNFTYSSAKKEGGAIFVAGDNATISNSRMSFNNATYNGGAVYVEGDNTNITGSIFDRCAVQENDGGAIYISGLNTTISKSNFTRNSANGTDARGGSIIIQGNNTSILDSIFSNCSAYYGAVIYVEGTNAIIDGSNFTYSSAKKEGGAIFVAGDNATISNSYLSYNNATTYGGAIYIEGDDTNITKTTFECCEAREDDGGAIYIKGLNATISDSTFKLNRVNNVSGRGGSINIQGNNTQITNSTFIQCMAYEGAVIYVKGTNAVIDKSFFDMSTAYSSGGAIYVAGDNATISNSNIARNNATECGGAVYVAGNNANITNTTFTMCVAIDKDGGAIYIKGLNTTISKSRFYKNVANGTESRGGAINIQGINTKILDSNFTMCLATEGGAIYINGTGVEINGSSFKFSSADYGGAIYIMGDDVDIDGLNLSYNNATISGGAIYVAGDNADILNTNFTICIAKAGNGGAIYIEGLNTHVEESNFNFTQSTNGLGGAIYIEGMDALLCHSNFQFSNATNGGSIYIAGDNAVINHTSMMFSSATQNGGAVYVEGDNATISADFKFNNATGVNGPGCGGAIYIEGNNTNITGSSFFMSNAKNSGFGGAIYILGDETNIEKSEFSKGNADRGGSIYVAGHNAFINNGTFHDNFATGDGGVLYIVGDDCELYNSTFTDNSVLDDGGAIYWEGDRGIVYNITCNNNNGTGTGTPHSTKGGTIIITGDDASLTKSLFTNSFAGVVGGTIFVTGNNANITDTIFENSTVGTSDGGAIYIIGHNTLIDNCTFKNCTSPTNAGVIHIEGNKTTVNNSAFIKNSAIYDGGAIYVAGDDVKIYNSRFINNTVGDDGGAIYWEGDRGIVYNITCINNNGTGTGANNGSSTKGGAIIITGENATLSESRFSDSYAGYLGGTIFITGNNANVTGCTFENSTIGVDNGGAMYIIGNNTLVNNCTFNNCTSPKNAGVMYIEGDNVTVNNSRFTNNKAIFDGGAIYAAGDDGGVYNSKFINNTVGDDGGAIYWEGHRGTMYNITCINNNGTGTGAGNSSSTKGGVIIITGENATLSKSNFENSYAGYLGGTIFITGNNANVTDSKFKKSSVGVDDGGTLYIIGNYTNVDNCTFEESHAVNGGAIYIQGKHTHINNSNISNCYSNINGGAIYVNGTNAVISANFVNCNASTSVNGAPAGNGGAIYVAGNYTNITKSTFKETHAKNKGNGGAIYIGGVDATVEKSEFYKTDSNNGNGGAIYIDGDHAVITGSVFNETVAGTVYSWVLDDEGNIISTQSILPGNGGAIYVKSENARITDSIVTSSIGIDKGGAIFVEGNNATISVEFINCSAGRPQVAAETVNVHLYDSYMATINANMDDIIRFIESLGTIERSDLDSFVSALNSAKDKVDSIFVNKVFDQTNFNAVSTYIQISNLYLGLMKGKAPIFDTLTPKMNEIIADLANIQANQSYTEFNNPIKNRIKNDINSMINFVNYYIGFNESAYNLQGNISIIFDDANYFPIHNQIVVCQNIRTSLVNNYYNKLKQYNSTFNQISANLTAIYNNLRTIDNQLAKYTNVGYKGEGGAIYVLGNNTNITSSLFKYCSAEKDGNGGAVNIAGVNATIEKSTFNDVKVTNNAYGGAIYISGTNATVIYSNITKASARSGGAIYITGESANITNTTFKDIETIDSGGAIYITGSNATIVDSQFENVSANGHGGAIYVDGEYTTIDESSFVDCVANGPSKNGGAIYINHLGTTVTHSNFTASYASQYGGAIYINGINTTIEYCNLDDNKAGQYAGAIYVAGTNTRLYYVNFTNNSGWSGSENTDVGGGALFISGQNASVYYSIFRDNFAVANGGAICWYGGHGDDSIIGCIFINNTANNTGRGGGAIYWSAGSQITPGGIIRDCLFINNTAANKHGGAIDWYRSIGALFDNCTFINNYASSDGGALYAGDTNGGSMNLTVINCKFYNNTANKSGGAFSNQMGNATIINCTFDGNKAVYQGGTILMKDNAAASNTVIDNCTISNSMITGVYDRYHDGGAISIAGSNANITISNTFIINSIANITKGGAIDIKTADCKLINVTIINATAKSDVGGAIYWVGKNAYMYNVTIINASAGTAGENHDARGGAIYLSSTGANLTMITVINSSSTTTVGNANGGAIYVIESANCRADNITIINSYSKSDNGNGCGGAVYWSATNGKLTNLTVINATGNYHGGALYVLSSNTIVDTVNIINASSIASEINKCFADGGAIYWSGSNGNLVNVYIVNATSKSSYDVGTGNIGGGAIFWSSVSGNLNGITIINSSISSVRGGIAKGGAIYCEKDDAVITNVYIFNSTSNYRGGAIYWANARGKLINATIINSHTEAPNKDSAADGGAIFWAGTYAYMENVSISNSYSNTSYTGTSSSGTAHGGAIYLYAANAVLFNVTITNASANSIVKGMAKGGAIYVLTSANKIYNSTIRNVTNRDDGGAIYWYGGTGELINCSLTNTSSESNGGAVYWTGANGKIINSSFENASAIEGGAIYVNHYLTTFHNVTFINNRANTTGGAVKFANNNNVKNTVLSKGLFINNTVLDGTGGAVAANAEGITLKNSTFIGNTAKGTSSKGGAIHATGQKVKIYNSTFTNNTALEGGAIYSSSSYHLIDNATFTNNTANDGGAVKFEYNGAKYAQITTSSFENNTANATGGAISWAAEDGTLKNTTFVSNSVINESGRGGAIYWTGARATIQNNTFIKNNACGFEGEGGAIYINSVNGVIKDNIFKNNTAKYGGAVFVVNAKSVDNSLFRYNRAVNGSAIYVNITAINTYLDVMNSIFLENQAHSHEIKIYDVTPYGTGVKFKVYFRGKDNIINAMFNAANDVYFTNVTYLGVNGATTNTGSSRTKPTKTDEMPADPTVFYQSDYEINQSVEVIVYKGSTLVYNQTHYTDYAGVVDVTYTPSVDSGLNNNGRRLLGATINTPLRAEINEFSIKATHYEDNYYTGIRTAVGKNLTLIKIDSPDIFYLEDEIINITVYPEDPTCNVVPSGKISVTINGTQYDHTNFTLDENGTVMLNITGLHVNKYDIDVHYFGDNYYMPEDNSSSFRVKKIPSFIILDADSYPWSKSGSLNITVPADYPTTVTLNITGTNINPLTYTVHIDETGKLTWNLPTLPIGEYKIEGFYPENQDYYPSDNVTYFRVLEAAASVIVKVDDIYVGENATVNVTVYPSDKVTGNVTIYVDGINMGQYNLTNGFTQLFNVSGLKAGEHYAVAVYNGDYYYSPADNSTKFKVKKHDPPMSVTASNILVFDDGFIQVNLPANATGMVYLKVNGTPYYINLTNGERNISIPPLAYGTYRVNATYSGDDYWNGADNFTTFTVSKRNSTVDIQVANITYGEKELINVTINVGKPINATGVVTIKINDTIRVFENVRLIEGCANVTVSDLDVGNYTVKVTYDGDNNYNGNSSEAKFTVSKSSKLDIKLDTQNITFGDVEQITVYVNATGNVTIKINGDLYNCTKDLEGGKVTFDVSYLTPYIYSVEAIFNGNDKYTSISTSGEFKVEKATPKVNVTAKDIYYGQVENITVEVYGIYVGENAAGNVTVIVNGKSYNLTFTKDGKPIIEIPIAHIMNSITPFDEKQNISLYGLAVGEYPVKVIFNENGIYKEAAATASFNVLQVQSPIKLDVHDILVWDTEYINVTVHENATGKIILTIDDNDYEIDIVNGVARFNTSDLSVGRHYVWAHYGGDKNFSGNHTRGSFNVGPRDPKINVTADNLIVGQQGLIRIEIPANATGYVVVTGNFTDNPIYVDKFDNGKAELPVVKLVNGTYSVNIKYYGGGPDNYTIAENSTTFIVSKINTPIDIIVNDINYTERAYITVKVADDATGFITIKLVNGSGVIRNITLPVVNGEVNWFVDDLAVDKYTVYANYSGNYKYNENKTSNVFNVKKIRPTITIDSVETSPVRNATVVVHITPGTTGNVTITVNHKNYTGKIENGVVRITIDKLNSGNYTVDAYYPGDRNYTDASTTKENAVIVHKDSDYEMNVTADDTKVDLINTIVVNVPSDAVGEVAIYVNGSYKGNATIENGVAKLNVTNPISGKCIVEATFTDDKYAEKTATTNYYVSKWETPIVITVVNETKLYAGDVVTIIVSVPEDIRDNVTIVIDGRTYSGKVIDGNATFEVSGLIPGDKTVTAIYDGNYKYLANATTHDFTIKERPYDVNITPISVDVEDIYVGDVEKINVTVPVNATGKVRIEIDGKEYFSTVVDGVARFEVENLTAGVKTVYVYYGGDKNYPSNHTTGQFNVIKRPTNVTANAEDINVGDNEVITANVVPNDATGRVFVDIDGVRYYGTINDGIVKIIIPDLPSGEYFANVTYEGDDKYLPSTTTVKFIVSKLKTPIHAKGDVIEEGEDATIVVRVQEDATGTITITVNGKTYTKEVENGKAVFIVPGLTKGDWNVDAVYSGDKKYEGNSTITDVLVYRNNPSNNTTNPAHASSNTINLSDYPTGNPILVLLLILIALVATRRFKK